MQRRKTGKISIFSSLDIIFDFLTSWVENSNQVLTWNQYQVESECWNRVFKLSQKIDIKYLSWVRRLISKLDLMISLSSSQQDLKDSQVLSFDHSERVILNSKHRRHLFLSTSKTKKEESDKDFCYVHRRHW